MAFSANATSNDAAACYAWHFITAGTATDDTAALTLAATNSRHNVLPPLASTIKGRLWARVIAQGVASAAEVAGTAVTPSTSSIQVTQMFMQLGDVPQVSVVSASAPVGVAGLAYHSIGQYWTVTLNTTQSGAALLSVSASTVSAMGCGVTLASFPLFVSSGHPVNANDPVAAVANALSNSLTLRGPTSGAATSLASLGGPNAFTPTPGFPHDPCARNMLLVRAGARAVLFSDTALATTPASLITSPAPASVSSAAITQVGPFFVTSSGSLMLPNGTTLAVSSSIAGQSLALSTVRAAASRCDWWAGYGPTRISTAAVAWTAANAPVGTDTIVVAIPNRAPVAVPARIAVARTAPPPPKDAWTGWSSRAGFLDVGALVIPDVARIHDMDVDHWAGLLVVLARNTAGDDMVVAVDPQALVAGRAVTATGAEVRAVLTRTGAAASPQLDGGVKGASPRIVVGESYANDLFLYGDTLLYSADGARTLFEIQLTTRNPALAYPGLDAGEYIVQVATAPAPSSVAGAAKGGTPPTNAPQGQYAVLTSTNRVFVGMAGLREAVEVKAALTGPAGSYLLRYHVDGSLVALATTSGMPFVGATTISVNADMSVPDWNVPAIACPYTSFTTAPSAEYYLDTSSSLALSATTGTSGSQTRIKPMLQVTNASLTTTNPAWSATAFSADAGTTQFTASTTLSPNTSTRVASAAAIIAPQRMTLGCGPSTGPGPGPRVASAVRAACPPNRALAFVPNTVTTAALVAAPKIITCDAGAPQYTVTVPAGGWVDWDTGRVGSAAKSVVYDCARFGGAPWPAYYGYLYKPPLAVVEDGVVVANVTADTVLFEVLGNTAFSYNSTAQDAGCVAPPQTAASMLRDGGSWSRENYAPCYTTPAAGWTSTRAAATTYEILNETNHNRIQWSTAVDNTIFLFRAVVLDPKFSYCQLSVDFAVQVYGVPLGPGPQAGIVLGFVAIVLGVLGASYVWYRRGKAKEKTE
ncbi:hypothetical protein GGF32_004664 [Allomyces javanicus]|nr:hypothetical protein GGF32_004664 [Allomyces javanicus]